MPVRAKQLVEPRRDKEKEVRDRSIKRLREKDISEKKKARANTGARSSPTHWIARVRRVARSHTRRQGDPSACAVTSMPSADVVSALICVQS